MSSYYVSSTFFLMLFLLNIVTFNNAFQLQFTTNSNTMKSKIKCQHSILHAQPPKHEKDEGPIRIYFDISINNEEIGRLVFNLGSKQNYFFPKHCENVVKLCAEDLKPIDPNCSYVKCFFKYSPQFVETMPQYRWAHVLDGRGRNAVGRATDRIIFDAGKMKSCTHYCFGGVYYGMKYDGDMEMLSEAGVVLTVPLVGACRGSTGFSIVRVGESPQEWREKLLLNSAVIGWLESGIDVLRTMARQTSGPPMISASGKL
jgi:hypothetical protein